MKIMLSRACVGMAALLAGCAPVKHLQRPDPVDLAQFAPGDHRGKVIGALGLPNATIDVEGAKCELYKLYTRGPGQAGRVAIATTQVMADVLTFGLAEIVTNRIEDDTKATLHRVSFCYAQNDVLASVRDEGVAVDALPAADVAVLDPGGKVPETPKDGLLFGDGAAKPAPAPSQPPPAGQGRDLFPEAATK